MTDPRVRDALLSLACLSCSKDELNIYPMKNERTMVSLVITQDGHPSSIAIDEARARLLISTLEDIFYPKEGK